LPLTLNKEHTLLVFESIVLRGICGHNGDEVAGEWRKLHIEELHDIRMVKAR
jgi:hypothetical protein